MQKPGLSLLIAGFAISLLSLLLKTTVTTSMPSVTGYLTTTSEVHNLGLLQRQMMVFIGGQCTALAGVILLVASHLERRLSAAVDGPAGFSLLPPSSRPTHARSVSAPPPDHPFHDDRTPEQLSAMRAQERREMKILMGLAAVVVMVAIGAAILTNN